MFNLKSTIEPVLKSSGALEAATAGPGKLLVLSKDDRKRLLDNFEQQAKFLNKIVIAIVVLQFCLFGLAAYIIFYYRDSPNVIMLLLGGSVLSLVIIINGTFRLLKTKNWIDLIRITLPSLPPKEALAFLQDIHSKL